MSIAQPRQSLLGAAVLDRDDRDIAGTSRRRARPCLRSRAPARRTCGTRSARCPPRTRSTPRRARRRRSRPALAPALPIASRTTSTASRFDFRFGAKPPSSPTPVDRPRPLQDSAQRVEDLGARRAGPPPNDGEAQRHHHELLEVDVGVGVGAAVQDVHHRHGQGVPAGIARQMRDVRVERPAGGRGLGLERRHRDAEQGVGAKPALGGRAVERDQCLVERALSRRATCRPAAAAISPLTCATAFVTPLPR